MKKMSGKRGGGGSAVGKSLAGVATGSVGPITRSPFSGTRVMKSMSGKR